MKLNDFKKGMKLVSKSGSQLKYVGKSKEYSWLVICEFTESFVDSRGKVHSIKGERGYFEPEDLKPLIA